MLAKSSKSDKWPVFLPVTLAIFVACLLAFVNPLVISLLFAHLSPGSTHIGNIWLISFCLVSEAGSLIALSSYLNKHQKYLWIIASRFRASIYVITLGIAVILTTVELLLWVKPLPGKNGDVLYKVSPYSIHRLKEHQDVVGSDGKPRYMIRNGFRGEGVDFEKREGEFRVVILGGSFVFDLYAPLGKDWPRLVQDKLADMGHENITVVNAGVPSHLSFDSVSRLLTEIPFLNPDIVIIINTWNDLKIFRHISGRDPPLRIIPSLVSADERPGWRGKIQDSLWRFQTYRRFRRSGLTRFLSKGARRIGLEGYIGQGEFVTDYSDLAIKQFKLNIEVFSDIAKNIGAQPVLVTQPRLVHPGNTEDERNRIGYGMPMMTHKTLCRAFEECDRAIVEVAQAHGDPFLDLSDEFTGNAACFTDHVHLTEIGSELVSARMAEFLDVLIRAREHD